MEPALIPGAPDAQGEIIRRNSGILAAMFSDTERKDDAWAFMKWFASAQTQSKYCNRLICTYGADALNAAFVEYRNLAWKPCTTPTARPRGSQPRTRAREGRYPPPAPAADARILQKEQKTMTDKQTAFPQSCLIDMALEGYVARKALRCNGEALAGVMPGRYHADDRAWQNGDTLSMRLDMLPIV